ncbi:MAG: catM [Polyangiaceae bacterium]|nr:catM [Polyangiaceae bacterium]
MILESRHLQTVAAVADTGSLTAAAKRLHLTLSAVSHQLRELESLFGAALFDRKARPIKATPAGERLLLCARQALPLLAQAEADVLAIVGQKPVERLFLALECHSCIEWLLPALDELRAARPDLDVDLRLGPRFDPIPALLSREVDAVLSTDRTPDPEVHHSALFRYEIVLLVSSEHALATRDFVEPAELAEQPFVTYPVELTRLDFYTRFLRPAGVEPNVARTAELTSVLVQLVRSRRGAAALPRWAVADELARGGLATVRLGPEGLHSEVLLSTRATDTDSSLMRAFLAVARSVSRNSLDGVVPID